MKQRPLVSFRPRLEQLESRLTMSGPGSSNPHVLPPQSHPFGRTYGEWEAAFWQWEFSLPVDHHPLFDTAPASAGQSGHTWFLGGTFTSTVGPGGVVIGQADRVATIPAGTALFFPLVNAEASTVEGNGTTQAELSAVAKSFADFIDPSSLFAEVDGNPVQGLASFRAQSPSFTFGPLPDNNILQFFGLDAPAGTTSLSVSDGYHVMLAPLSVGEHTLHFGGNLHLVAPGIDLTFTQDITYHLTVVAKAGARSAALAADAAFVSFLAGPSAGVGSIPVAPPEHPHGPGLLNSTAFTAPAVGMATSSTLSVGAAHAHGESAIDAVFAGPCNNLLFGAL